MVSGGAQSVVPGARKGLGACRVVRWATLFVAASCVSFCFPADASQLSKETCKAIASIKKQAKEYEAQLKSMYDSAKENQEQLAAEIKEQNQCWKDLIDFVVHDLSWSTTISTALKRTTPCGVKYIINGAKDQMQNGMGGGGMSGSGSDSSSNSMIPSMNSNSNPGGNSGDSSGDDGC